ncbi:hypothetical protein M422DRAFT_254824 [Sphaerobolus stellatus SS14]|uniref:Uncharacterized protein n=1 Tax=Sphaerobolus stellatus (strain SS14) TaxID=990650 RepID=A0A0C9VU90_SPHS4|nr:hypothetical protein M422DRAFT_254824 [Sphaerobolus stellatus SS14]
MLSNRTQPSHGLQRALHKQASLRTVHGTGRVGLPRSGTRTSDGDAFSASAPNIRRVPVSELSFFPQEPTSFSSRPPSKSPPVAAVGRPSLANLLSGAKEIVTRMAFDSAVIPLK